jgi:two-component system, OmpR family, phosphate regulon sensor histidine kinase PhoR
MRLRTRLFLVSATTALFAVVSTIIIALIGSTLLDDFTRPADPSNPYLPTRQLDFVYSAGALLATVIVPILAAALLSWLASRTVGARIGEIVGMANRLSSGDLGSRVRDVRQDEFGELGRALDDAVQSLGQKVGELARDRARMEAILGGMVEGVLVVNQQGQVQLVNDAARAMLRLDDKAIGRRYVELIRHPDIAGQLTRALAGEAPGGVELSLGRDLSQILIARAAPVVASGSTGAVLVLHDISDLRRADRIRRDFVANVSHELRTPLTAIRGYVEALLDAPPRPEETRRFLEIIARHSSRMERLVKDLLRLARLDAGQEALETAPCSVEALLAGVIGDLTPVLEGRDQEVDVKVAAEAATVSGDPAKLHDVLRNLVENASNYSPEGSKIELSSEIESSGSSGSNGSGNFVVIRVADRGPGIPEADLTRIFERFYRVDKDRSRESGGTGLGLSIVRHLVELHGGQVQASNRRDGGAIFTVRLPRRH